MLGLCFKDMGMWDEARRAFENALKMEGTPQDKELNAKYELGLLHKEQGRTEEAIELLRQISTVQQDFRDTKYEIGMLKGNRQSRRRLTKK